ncbi:MAG: IS110 family transposase [Rhodanobacteraceae bacterium]
MTTGVGIDVSKTCLDVATSKGARWRVVNRLAGWKELAKGLAGSDIRVVMEASGGYEQGVLDYLSASSFKVFRVNARQARDFAKGLGQLAKTDRLDAGMLAQMALLVTRLTPYQPATALQREVAQYASRRRQVVETIQRERQRIAALADPALRQWAKRFLASLQRQLEHIDTALRTRRQAWPPIQELRRMKGAGPVLLGALMGWVPELGRLSRREIAKLIGVAPLNDDSGQRRGPRRIWGGRAAVRTVLYMAAPTAIRHEPAIRAMYQRLRAHGKLPKVAIVACMRKMLVILNARARDHYCAQAA